MSNAPDKRIHPISRRPILHYGFHTAENKKEYHLIVDRDDPYMIPINVFIPLYNKKGMDPHAKDASLVEFDLIYTHYRIKVTKGRAKQPGFITVYYDWEQRLDKDKNFPFIIKWEWVTKLRRDPHVDIIYRAKTLKAAIAWMLQKIESGTYNRVPEGSPVNHG